jgi:hypothetical protein
MLKDMVSIPIYTAADAAGEIARPNPGSSQTNQIIQQICNQLLLTRDAFRIVAQRPMT